MLIFKEGKRRISLKISRFNWPLYGRRMLIGLGLPGAWSSKYNFIDMPVDFSWYSYCELQLRPNARISVLVLFFLHIIIMVSLLSTDASGNVNFCAVGDNNNPENDNKYDRDWQVGRYERISRLLFNHQFYPSWLGIFVYTVSYGLHFCDRIWSEDLVIIFGSIPRILRH